MVVQMYKVRGATLEDVPFLSTVVGKDMCTLLGDSTMYDVEQMSNVLKSIIENVFVVIDLDGSIVGAMGALLLPFLWNPKITTYSEVFWWVREDKRNGRIGPMLLSTFEKIGKQSGAKRLVMTVMPSSKIGLEKCGYVHRELAMVKEV